MPDPETRAEVSGHCTSCSWGDRLVIHTVPWCPDFPATVVVDTNASWRSSIGSSRPVEVGELVLMVDFGDGRDHPFARWGRVTEITYPEGRDHCPYIHMEDVDGSVWTYA